MPQKVLNVKWTRVLGRSPGELPITVQLDFAEDLPITAQLGLALKKFSDYGAATQSCLKI